MSHATTAAAQGLIHPGRLLTPHLVLAGVGLDVIVPRLLRSSSPTRLLPALGCVTRSDACRSFRRWTRAGDCRGRPCSSFAAISASKDRGDGLLTGSARSPPRL
ncbi:MAG: hypothetical protein MI924_26660, partial [Chloroflexales bacterium]|nr:hypothetical protein [Chloroflexales bacterium]